MYSFPLGCRLRPRRCQWTQQKKETHKEAAGGARLMSGQRGWKWMKAYESHMFVHCVLFIFSMSPPFASSVNLLSGWVHFIQWWCSYIRIMPFTAKKFNGCEHKKSRWVLQMLLSGSKSCACNRTSWFVDCVRRVGSALSWVDGNSLD